LEANVKAIINWFKDLFYNATDYAIILCVVAVVAVVLFWRFDILFNLKLEKDTLKPNPITISNGKDDDKTNPPSDNTNNPTDGNNTGENNQGNGTDNPTPPEGNNTDGNKDPEQGGNSNPTTDGAEISFNIPAGTFPGKIADILIDKALIEDKQTFLTRCVEMKLDTKLKSGDFKIKKGTSLDDVIKTIAKQN